MSHSAFDKLRLARPAAVLAAALGGGGAAQAATVGLKITVTAGSVKYSSIGTSSSNSMVVGAGGTTSSSVDAYGISDATLLQPAATGTTTSQNDAFDRFAQIRVNGTFFTQPGAQVDLTTTADGAFVSTLTPLDIGGIDTSLDYFMDGDSPTLRVLATFTNTTGGSLAAEVQYGGNLGSDSNTQIEGTSSGDTVFQQADRWLISSDAGAHGDPVLTFARYGTGTVQAASTTYAVPGTDSGNGSIDYFTDVWNLTLDAGETQSLLWFVQFSPDTATASGGTGVFDDLSALDTAGLLAAAGGGTIGTANIVNWGPGQPASVPVPGALPLFGVGLFGLGAMRRRSRRD